MQRVRCWAGHGSWDMVWRLMAFYVFFFLLHPPFIEPLLESIYPQAAEVFRLVGLILLRTGIRALPGTGLAVGLAAGRGAVMLVGVLTLVGVCRPFFVGSVGGEGAAMVGSEARHGLVERLHLRVWQGSHLLPVFDFPILTPRSLHT